MAKASAASYFTAGMLAIGLSTSPVVAGPGSGLASSEKRTAIVETVQAYHRDCAWVNSGWHYKNRDKYVVCRPQHPGRGYVWHREGQRFGWYHPGRKHWHHNNW